MRLVEAADLRERVKDIPGLPLPKDVQDSHLEKYVDRASGQVLHTTRRTAPPAPSTPERQAMNQVTLDLAIVYFKMDLPPWMGAQARQQLLNEKAQLLRELDALTEDDLGGGVRGFVVGGEE